MKTRLKYIGKNIPDVGEKIDIVNFMRNPSTKYFKTHKESMSPIKLNKQNEIHKKVWKPTAQTKVANTFT
jgi:hypothetical protein